MHEISPEKYENLNEQRRRRRRRQKEFLAIMITMTTDASQTQEPKILLF